MVNRAMTYIGVDKGMQEEIKACNSIIKVTFFSKEWLLDNLVEWELVSINNVGYYTEEFLKYNLYKGFNLGILSK